MSSVGFSIHALQWPASASLQMQRYTKATLLIAHATHTTCDVADAGVTLCLQAILHTPLFVFQQLRLKPTYPQVA